MRRRASAKVFGLLGHEEKSILFITSCWSLLTIGWRHPQGPEGWKSTQTAMLDLTPFLEVFLGVRCAAGKPGETDKGWHEVHFTSVKCCELVPHFQATKYPKLPRNSPALFLWPHTNSSAPFCPTSASVPHPKIFCLSQIYVHIENDKNGIKPLLGITSNFMPGK